MGSAQGCAAQRPGPRESSLPANEYIGPFKDMHRPRRAFGGSFADFQLESTTGSISFKMTIFRMYTIHFIGLFVENWVWGEVGGYCEFQSVCLDMGDFQDSVVGSLVFGVYCLV